MRIYQIWLENTSKPKSKHYLGQWKADTFDDAVQAYKNAHSLSKSASPVKNELGDWTIFGRKLSEHEK